LKISGRIIKISKISTFKENVMKKLLIASAISLAMLPAAYADAKKEGSSWVGGFFEYYSTDEELSGAPNFLDNATGIGFEFGHRFKPNWAARIEFSRLDVDAQPEDETGSRVGIDALYFLPEDQFYVFTGFKRTNLVEPENFLNIGLGKHWAVNDKFNVVTELAGYQNLHNGTTDVGVKLGFTYNLGGGSSSVASYTSNDSDSDGVLDGKDRCANTPYGVTVDSNGCEVKSAAVANDADGDGVADNIDRCANTPSTDKVDATGCSIFEEEKVSENLRVLFANNSSVISNPDAQKFQEFADFMKRFPSTDAVIEGHASAPGDAAYNMMLSEKRAKAVRTLLIEKYGISANRLTAVGYGETRLLDTSNTVAAHTVNRRIVAEVSASKRVKLTK
jgi:OOP family OmpA-OmpF porin